MVERPISVSKEHSFILGDNRVRLWSGRRQRSEELKELHWPTWIANWKYFRNYVVPFVNQVDWWRANESIPTAWKIVETIFPRWIMGLFDSPEWFTVEARNARSADYERLCQNLLLTKVEQMRAFPKFYDCLKYTCVMGHSWGKVTWREEYQKRQRLMPTITMDDTTGQPQIGVDQVIEDEEVFNGPDFDWCTLDSIWPDPSGAGDWYIERIETTLERLEQTQDSLSTPGEPYYNPEALAALRASLDTAAPVADGGLNVLDDARQGTLHSGTSADYIRETEVTENIPWSTITPMRDGTGVELWQGWGWVPREARLGEVPEVAWRLQVIANSRFVLRDVPSPTPNLRPPYFPVRSVIIPKRVYGASILEYIGPLCDQQSRLANMRLDEVYLGVWQQYLIKKGALTSDNQEIFKPGGYMEVQLEQGASVQDAVQILPRKPVMPDAYQEDAYRQNQAEDIAAANDVMRGQGSSSRQTATEIERLLQQGNARHALQVVYLEYTFKKELLARTWELLRMRMTKQQRVALGEEYAEVDLSHIQEPIDIVVGGGIFGMSKAARVAMDQELVSLLQIPQFAAISRPDAIFRQLLMDRGWRSPERFILTPAEIQAQQQRALIAQMLGEGGDGKDGMNAGAGSGEMAALLSQAGAGESGAGMPGMPPSGAAEGMVGTPPSQGGMG
jgi:hypothetical protein